MLMVSLIRLLLRLFRPERIIQIRRMPLASNLRFHLLGLTLAFVVAVAAISLNTGALFTGVAWPIIAILVFLFALGTYIGGPFVLLAALLSLLPATPSSPPSFFFLFHALSEWYFIGYAFGAILAIFYNDLIFLHLLAFGQKQIKIAFAYDTAQPINIIKSPMETEEAALLEVLKSVTFYIKQLDENSAARIPNAQALTDLIRQAKQKMCDRPRPEMCDDNPVENQKCLKKIFDSISLPGDNLDEQIDELQRRLAAGDPAALELVEEHIEPLVEQYLKLEERKFYHYHLEAPPAKPYTIVFVANPKIHKRIGPPAFEKDPIINDLDLFLRGVDRALAGLEADDVLGRPEIWSRVRVITIFDPCVAEALVEEYQTTAVIDGQVIDNLVNPMESANFAKVIENHLTSIGLDLTDVDVVFAMTASPTHDRSTAYYADWDELTVTRENQSAPGKEFGYAPDPNSQKDGEILAPVLNVSPFFRKHDFGSESFGRVALNVVGARQKVFIHEFAHAMSSASHGMICDEYADQFYVEHICLENAPPPTPKFYVNRIERNKAGLPDNRVIPVHEIFAEYNGVLFHSDLAHPSARENWVGYFPERHSPGLGCIMDRETGPYRFDKLISRFMYDRLVAKLNRP